MDIDSMEDLTGLVGGRAPEHKGLRALDDCRAAVIEGFEVVNGSMLLAGKLADGFDLGGGVEHAGLEFVDKGWDKIAAVVEPQVVLVQSRRSF